MSDLDLTHSDYDRITSAISDQEAQTSGEIFAVIAKSSDDYLFVSTTFSALWALIVGLLVALFAYWQWAEIPLTTFVFAQVSAFLAAWFLLYYFPSLRIRAVPQKVRYRRAHANAVGQFLAHGIHNTRDHTGVLIFVSMLERYGVVLADSGIDARVEQKVWDHAVETLIHHVSEGRVADGFIGAIEETGLVLRSEFPRRHDDENELENKLIVL